LRPRRARGLGRTARGPQSGEGGRGRPGRRGVLDGGDNAQPRKTVDIPPVRRYCSGQNKRWFKIQSPLSARPAVCRSGFQVRRAPAGDGNSEIAGVGVVRRSSVLPQQDLWDDPAGTCEQSETRRAFASLVKQRERATEWGVRSVTHNGRYPPPIDVRRVLSCVSG
jgi:hypothetical protein